MSAAAPAAPPARDVVARARDILAGRLRPEPLTLSPERQAVFDRLIHEHVTPTPEAYRFHHEQWALDEHHGGKVVAVTRLADGTLAVLASGEAEVMALFDARRSADLPGFELAWPHGVDCPLDTTHIRGY